MEKTIALLPGDGIGPEVMVEARKVLEKIAQSYGHTFNFTEGLIGGAAYEVHQNHCPDDMLAMCAEADAILLSAVGGPVNAQNEPKWKGAEKAAILGIRKHFNFNINLRPATIFPELISQSPLKSDVIGDGLDIMIIRELNGGIYFGEHKIVEEDGVKVGYDEMRYDAKEVEAIGRLAFETAQKRGKKLCSVDKANVLSASIVWREVMEKLAPEYSDVELTHMYVDNAAMQLVRNPNQFDVIVTGNMFGDILSDLSSVFAGSLGVLASASMNKDGFGLYEPSGGSAPDIAGLGIANPIAQILSAAMMLKYSFGMWQEHDAIVRAVKQTLADGLRTKDIWQDGCTQASTSEMGDAIVQNTVKLA